MLERSVDPSTSNWSFVGAVDAKNVSGATQSYALTDEAFSRLSYYRLTTVDYGGSRSVSDIVSIERSNGIGLAQTTISPNPTTGFVSLRIPSTNEDVRLTVFSITGQLIREQSFAAGSETAAVLDLSPYKSGVYLFRLESQEMTITRRVVRE